MRPYVPLAQPFASRVSAQARPFVAPQALEAEHVQSGADLALLTRDDCKELGFSIGERNRVADWAARVVRLIAIQPMLRWQYQTDLRMPTGAEAATCKRRVGRGHANREGR